MRKSIDGYPGYFVTSDGEVIGRSGKALKPYLQDNGYLTVTLWNGQLKTFYVHILVANAFLPEKPSLEHTVDHINRRRVHNAAFNLRWATRQDQQANADTLRGGDVALSKLTEKDVLMARKLHANGASFTALAREFGVTISTIRKAVIGITWRHLCVSTCK